MERAEAAAMGVMPITTTFAFRMRALNRQKIPLEAIALRLRGSEDDVRWAHQVINQN